ncbi:MAG: excinuclease ABC subunit UvrC [Lachnospiraceae bacterium]|nr:excinuclease ABC subunit UvrC [Robinsoniella sp.]MDY3765496.1 excinuclease ABC subunit UvrC [Lachnospiraceae bacterium]
MFQIEEELKKLPSKPGVYLMHDADDVIIYVGKAISLKNRVRQYFQSSRVRSSKIEKMVSLISRFEYIVTDSELEALVLECNLIKEYQPKYNTMLKDGKTYPFIKVTTGEAYPRVFAVHSMKKEKAKYYGPYTSSKAVNDTIDLIQKLFKLRTCSNSLPRESGKGRACLNYHIGQCNAPCQGLVSQEEYRAQVDQAIRFLEGEHEPVIKMLEQKMLDASERMDFECAMEQRDLIESVRQISQKQKITQSDGEDRDIIAAAVDENDAVVQVFFMRGGKMIGRDHFYLRVAMNDTISSILNSFLKQFYSGTPFIPRELMIQTEVEDHQILEEWLSKQRGSRVHIRVPKKGTKEKLVELAEKNAKMVLEQDRERIKREEAKTIGAMREIADLLGLEKIARVEAFDISNTSGIESVGSMVVYENGKPKKSDYRKFKIQWVKGPNDYASMEEVLTKRFQSGLEEQREKKAGEGLERFSRFPDLIMMDGGKGQVSSAKKVLEQLHLEIPVCGMVKDDNHRTRGLYFENREVDIDRNSEGFHLITRIQDEAHRFAIEYHRALRGKAQVHSILDDIEGIGPARRKSLMRTFVSLDAIREASLEELQKAPSMNRQSALKVYEFFHSS